MNKNYTLKELADMFASVRREALSNGQSIEGARELALKHILDAIDYQLTKDEEREAFAKWWVTSDLQTFCNSDDAFKAWKAGREELWKAGCSAQCRDTKTEPAWILDKQPVVPAWIPWYGGDKSPIVGEQTRYEVECRSGARNIWNTNFLRWSHDGSLGDIMAYRILDSEQCEKTKTETAWIPWNGSYKSPIVGKQTKFEVKYRDGVMQIYTQNNPLCWRHDGNFSDIIAYRILD